jgi:hypothetical protein
VACFFGDLDHKQGFQTLFFYICFHLHAGFFTSAKGLQATKTAYHMNADRTAFFVIQHHMNMDWNAIWKALETPGSGGISRRIIYVLFSFLTNTCEAQAGQILAL